jgi:hypothetical protein
MKSALPRTSRPGQFLPFIANSHVLIESVSLGLLVQASFSHSLSALNMPRSVWTEDLQGYVRMKFLRLLTGRCPYWNIVNKKSKLERRKSLQSWLKKCGVVDTSPTT